MVSLTAGQKAALSREAITFLKSLSTQTIRNTIPNFLTMPSRIPGLRRGLGDKMAPLEAELIEKHKLQLEEITVAGVPVIVVQPSVIQPEKKGKLLLNMSGGAFVMGSPKDRTALIMAVELGVRVYSIDYTHSPEAKYPVARNECLAVYREIIQKGLPGYTSIKPSDIYTMGTSSGAQLLVSMLLLAKQEGVPTPTAGMYLCTPALDMTGAGDSLVFNAYDRDVMPVSLLVGMVTQNYAPAGIDPADPLFSPMYGEYTASLPPTVITVGTRDFYLSNGIRFYWKLREGGVKVELLVSDGMWHGFNWDLVMPEAIRTRVTVIDSIENSTKRGGS